MAINNEVLQHLRKRTEELHELMVKYDTEYQQLELYDKNEFLQEISIKIQLVISYILRAIYHLSSLAEQGAFIARAEVKNDLSDLREQLKTYQSMDCSFSEILRSSRINVEYSLEMEKEKVR